MLHPTLSAILVVPRSDPYLKAQLRPTLSRHAAYRIGWLEARHVSLSPDQYELNKEPLMTASARMRRKSGAICRVATEPPKQAKNSSANPAAVERRSSKQRSRLTNGTALLPDIDGRSAIARRFKDIAHGILADQGGADQCSECRLQLVRRFAAAAVLAEQMESRLANGEQIDIQEHALLCSTLTRLAQRIGIERRARDVTPPDPLHYAREYDTP
jgi:hypothetical protein